MRYRANMTPQQLIQMTENSFGNSDFMEIEVQYLDVPNAPMEKMTIRVDSINFYPIEHIDARTQDGRWFRMYGTDRGLEFHITPPNQP